MAVLGALVALVVLRKRLGDRVAPGILASDVWELEPELAEAGAVS